MKRQLGRPGHRWKDTVEMDVKEKVCEVVDWLLLVQCRTSGVNTVI
jgi:hypothetical protein